MPAGFTAERSAPDDLGSHPEVSDTATAVRFPAVGERPSTAGHALGRAVATAGLQPIGPIRYVRFDPPWKPWFLRRNEVVLPVRE
jgi:hypothetical protein